MSLRRSEYDGEGQTSQQAVHGSVPHQEQMPG
jgi:hypothetical protein